MFYFCSVTDVVPFLLLFKAFICTSGCYGATSFIEGRVSGHLVNATPILTLFFSFVFTPSSVSAHCLSVRTATSLFWVIVTALTAFREEVVKIHSQMMDSRQSGAFSSQIFP